MKGMESISENVRNAGGDITELVFVLDRSGSMGGLEEDTIGGFNSMIAKQQGQAGRAFVTAVLFDHEVEVLFEHVPLADVGKLTEEQYYVRGCTALLDAVGETIKRVNRAHKSNPEGRPARTIFAITTDGMENASKNYTLEEVRKAIEKRKRKNGWEFIFLGANIDAVETAGSMGIAPEYAADYAATSMGTRSVYTAIGAALCSFRTGGTVSEEWKDGLGE